MVKITFIKKMFIELFTSAVNASNHKKYISLNNQHYIIQPTLVNSHSNEYKGYITIHLQLI